MVVPFSESVMTEQEVGTALDLVGRTLEIEVEGGAVVGLGWYGW